MHRTHSPEIVLKPLVVMHSEIGYREFSKAMEGIVKDIIPDPGDETAYSDMCSRLKTRTFLPKQKNTDNRVIPHQCNS